jgi:hypothetical protein
VRLEIPPSLYIWLDQASRTNVQNLANSHVDVQSEHVTEFEASYNHVSEPGALPHSHGAQEYSTLGRVYISVRELIDET